MRVFTLMVFAAIIATSLCEPEPKKYKAETKKVKPSNSSLTDEERKFLRDVEAKFNIKSETKEKKKEETTIKAKPDIKLPFPAVIAIEIVNDTDTKGKGKRTIDANLGYGYKTNNGYSYSYFGKPAEDKGKYMIYPYSQEDIPPSNGQMKFTEVEIQPSRAFELVTVNDEKEGYDYPKPATQFKSGYENQRLPSYSHHGHSQHVPSTLYTTYNGHELSGLTGHFPSVMPNYYVDQSQLLQNPEYQNVGLTNDLLRTHGPSSDDKRVVPVLVLRIPSSSLKNPTAEIFPNLPSSYPMSKYLNNVNLQELVNQYFKKQGYSSAPQVNYHESAHSQQSSDSQSANVASHYGTHYASPHVQPAYTQSAHSGVQYSAVQPVMARYPSSYTRHSLSHGHSLYQMPYQQKYEHRYQYTPQSQLPQTYYVQSQYQQYSHEPARAPETSSHDTSSHVQYETVPQVSSQSAAPDVYEYRTPQTHEEVNTEYQYVKQEEPASASPSYEQYSGSVGAQEYYTQSEVPKETLAIIPTHEDQNEQHTSVVDIQTYHYQQQQQQQQQQSSEEDNHGLAISENYPSKDHTIATVYPISYKQQPANSGAVQTVSYVTPTPYSSKYRSPYRIMVPQTFLMNPSSTEKVTYVNSHSMSSYSQNDQSDYNPEAEYTVGPHYVPPISKQKPPSYPRNYHTYPKRMVKTEKHATTPSFMKKSERRTTPSS